MGVLLLVNWFAFAWRTTPLDPQTDTGAIVDVQSAWRLRRIALSVDGTRLAQVDAFASFPDSVACVDLPLFDEVAGVALRLLLGWKSAGQGRSIDERALLRFGSWVGPVGLGLWLLLLYSLLRGSLRASRGASLLALGFVGVAPIVVEAGRPGTIWIELFVALLAFVQLKTVLGLWQTKQPLDRLTSAMIAGGIGSLGLVLSPIYIVPTFAIWTALFAAAMNARGEERADLVRCTLLFWIATGVGGLLPAIGGPWVPVHEGPIAGWTSLWGYAFLLGIAPFLWMHWRSKEGLDARVANGVLAIAMVAGAFALYRMGPDHSWSALLFAAVGWDAAGPWADSFAGSALLALWSVPFLLVLVASRAGRESSAWHPQEFLIACWGSAALAIAVLHPPLALLFAAPAAYGIARLADHPRGFRFAIGLLSIAFVWGGFVQFDSHRTLGSNSIGGDDERLDGLSAARWLRANTRVSGPWNSVHAGQSWGVLCAPSMATVVAFHGRRPTTTFGRMRNGDPAGRHRVSELLGTTSAVGVVREARELGIEFVILSPVGVNELERHGAHRPALEALYDEPAAAGASVVWESRPNGGGRILAVGDPARSEPILDAR